MKASKKGFILFVFITFSFQPLFAGLSEKELEDCRREMSPQKRSSDQVQLIVEDSSHMDRVCHSHYKQNHTAFICGRDLVLNNFIVDTNGAQTKLENGINICERYDKRNLECAKKNIDPASLVRWNTPEEIAQFKSEIFKTTLPYCKSGYENIKKLEQIAHEAELEAERLRKIKRAERQQERRAWQEKVASQAMP